MTHKLPDNTLKPLIASFRDPDGLPVAYQTTRGDESYRIEDYRRAMDDLRRKGQLPDYIYPGYERHISSVCLASKFGEKALCLPVAVETETITYELQGNLDRNTPPSVEVEFVRGQIEGDNHPIVLRALQGRPGKLEPAA